MSAQRPQRGQSFLTLPSPHTRGLPHSSPENPLFEQTRMFLGHRSARPRARTCPSAGGEITGSGATTRHSQASYKEHEAGGTARPSKSLCEINVLPTATLLCYSVIVRRVVHIKLRNRECVDEAFQSTEAPKSGARSVRLRAFRYSFKR